MPSQTYLPGTQGALLEWAANFSNHLENDAAGYGLSADQASVMVEKYLAFSDAYKKVTTPEGNSRSNYEAKKLAKAAMVEKVRELVKIIQAWPGTTDQKRVDLGITVPDPDPTPCPVPGVAPRLGVVTVRGHTVELSIKQEAGSGRGKPAGAIGATVMVFIGESMPTTLGAWEYAGNVTKATEPIEFPSTVPAGSKVWMTAFWYTRTGKTSPAAEPIHAYLGMGLSKSRFMKAA